MFCTLFLDFTFLSYYHCLSDGCDNLTKCSCPTALVASSKNSQVFHYGGRALNKVAIPNKASLSFCGFVNLPSPLYQVTCDKENKMEANKAVSIFNFNNQNVRTILINNEPYFCLKDVCEILGVRNSRHALSRLTPKGVVKSDTLTKGGTQSLNFINEANLYKVIFKSVKPEAIKFEEWVTSEILPSIRKNGSYNVNNSPYHLVNKHNAGFNNINTEAELVHAAKANLSSLVNILEELNIANITIKKGYSAYNYALNKRVYIKKESLKDYLQHQVDTLSQAFNIMYQPYYKEIINLEHSKKYKELQSYLNKQGACNCNLTIKPLGE